MWRGLTLNEKNTLSVAACHFKNQRLSMASDSSGHCQTVLHWSQNDFTAATCNQSRSAAPSGPTMRGIGAIDCSDATRECPASVAKPQTCLSASSYLPASVTNCPASVAKAPKCVSASFYVPASVTNCPASITRTPKCLSANLYMPASVAKIPKSLSASFYVPVSVTNWPASVAKTRKCLSLIFHPPRVLRIGPRAYLFFSFSQPGNFRVNWEIVEFFPGKFTPKIAQNRRRDSA